MNYLERMCTTIVLLLKRPVWCSICYHLTASQDWLPINRSPRIKHRVNVTQSAYNPVKKLILPHFAKLLTGNR